METGRAVSGASNDKTRTIVKRIRFTLAPEKFEKFKDNLPQATNATELAMTRFICRPWEGFDEVAPEMDVSETRPAADVPSAATVLDRRNPVFN